MRHNRNQRLMAVLCAMGMLASVSCGDKSSEQKAAKAPEGKGTPKIQAVNPEFDFGQVKQGANVEHTFKLKNVGTADLEIDKTRGS